MLRRNIRDLIIIAKGVVLRYGICNMVRKRFYMIRVGGFDCLFK